MGNKNEYRVCRRCGAPLEHAKPDAKYCPTCKQTARQEALLKWLIARRKRHGMDENGYYHLECQLCHEKFETKRRNSKFCPGCRSKENGKLYRERKRMAREGFIQERRKNQRPLTMAEIRRRAVPLVSGWRGRPCAGGFCPQVRHFYY